MLAYFDRHGTPTEASFTCAAMLAGVATTLLGPVSSASYVGHLLLCDHDVGSTSAAGRPSSCPLNGGFGLMG
jgi:hypothetical protein